MIQAYAVHEAGAKLEEFAYDPGQLGDMEVEIDVQYCGICHSDLSMINNEWGISQYPMVPGHEVVGTVSAVGDRVDHFLVGDSVGLGWHSGYCMRCTSCLSGHHNLCESAQPTIVGHNGGFADKVRAAADSIVRLPDGMDKESAGPLFCGGITVFTPLLEYGVKPTDRVGVIGIGGLGHIALQFYKAWGCEVTAFTSTEEKKSEALELGAHHVLSSSNSDEIQKAAGTLDFLISTANAHLDWNTYLTTLRPLGKLVHVGIFLEPLDVSLIPLMTGQRSIGGSAVGSPLGIATMLEFASRHQIKPLIETYKFEQVNQAMDRLKSGDARYRIVLAR